MRKKILVVTALIAVLLTGCGNKTLFDTTYSFDRAIIKLPNGEVMNVEVKEWTDYEDGEQIQIKTKDGKVYLVHSSNCVLIDE